MSLEVNMSNKNKQTKPKYTLEFKQDAAKLFIWLVGAENQNLDCWIIRIVVANMQAKSIVIT